MSTFYYVIRLFIVNSYLTVYKFLDFPFFLYYFICLLFFSAYWHIFARGLTNLIKPEIK